MLLLALFLAFGLFGSGDEIKKSRLIGYNVSDFSIPTLDNKSVITPDLWKGKVVVVNIFASWCEPCTIEHPALMRLSQSQKVEIIGIAWKDKPEKVAAWLKERGVPFHHIGVDTDGKITFGFGLTGVPETFIIDKKGKIAFNHKAPIDEEMVDDVILPMIEFLRK